MMTEQRNVWILEAIKSLKIKTLKLKITFNFDSHYHRGVFCLLVMFSFSSLSVDQLCKRTLLWKVLKKKDMWQVFIHYQLFYFEKVHMGRRHPTPNPPDPSPKISVVQYTCGNDKKNSSSTHTCVSQTRNLPT